MKEYLPKQNFRNIVYEETARTFDFSQEDIHKGILNIQHNLNSKYVWLAIYNNHKQRKFYPYTVINENLLEISINNIKGIWTIYCQIVKERIKVD